MSKNDDLNFESKNITPITSDKSLSISSDIIPIKPNIEPPSFTPSPLIPIQKQPNNYLNQ